MTAPASYVGRATTGAVGQTMLGAMLCLMASSAAAEGRNDPFMRCTFEDGRIVVLAENGPGFEWREGAYVAAMVSESPRLADDPILTFLLPNAEPERIDVFLGWFRATDIPAEVGAAMLSRTIFDQDGQLTSATIPGKCEDFFG